MILEILHPKEWTTSMQYISQSETTIKQLALYFKIGFGSFVDDLPKQCLLSEAIGTFSHSSIHCTRFLRFLSSATLYTLLLLILFVNCIGLKLTSSFPLLFTMFKYLLSISPRTVLKISEPIGKFDMLTKSTVLLLARWAPLFTLSVFWLLLQVMCASLFQILKKYHFVI